MRTCAGHRVFTIEPEISSFTERSNKLPWYENYDVNCGFPAKIYILIMVLLWISVIYENAGKASAISYTPWKLLKLMENILGIFAKFKSKMEKFLFEISRR